MLLEMKLILMESIAKCLCVCVCIYQRYRVHDLKRDDYEVSEGECKMYCLPVCYILMMMLLHARIHTHTST